jgi:nitroreductase
LTAQSLGLGNCWVQIRGRAHNDEKTAEAYVKAKLGIPANLKVLSIIAVGYPARERKAVPTEDLQWEKIHRDRF